MKYRMLSQEELEIFEEDFKHFLIVNGVHGEEWEKMNQEQPEQAVQLVEMFSDTVLQKVYEKVKFIEHRSQSSCMVFNLKPENIELISIGAKNNAVDLSTPESIHKAFVEQATELTIFKTEKPYGKARELEIHEMIEQGCVNSSEAFWMQLEKLLD